MFPFGFWQDATLLIGAATIAEGLLLIGSAWAARRWARREQLIKDKAHQYTSGPLKG